MISFIEFADYVVGPVDSLCENGMIDNLSECKKAANKLNFHFKNDEYANDYPEGCYVIDDNSVFFNNFSPGMSCEWCRPICGKGK